MLYVMGNEVSKITSGIHISNALPAKSQTKLTEHKITHIVSILPKASSRFENEGITYKLVRNLTDKGESADQLKKLLPEIIEFIHDARGNSKNNGNSKNRSDSENNGDSEKNVLVHCLQGISRSVTFVVAYLMVVTNEPWDKVLDQVRVKRQQANPNPQFQRLLFEFCASSQKQNLQKQLGVTVDSMERERKALFG